MPIATWLDLDKTLRGIASGEVKVVGWGDGNAFRHHYPNTLLRLAYMVDYDPAKWGRTSQGFEIRNPEVLRHEDPEKTVILVYPFRFYVAEVQRRLADIGPFTILPPFEPAYAKDFLSRLNAGLAEAPARKPKAVSGNAIVVQGAVAAGNTECALRFYAARYPRDHLILSTWDNTPAALLEPLGDICDEIVLTPPPPVAGVQNRNLQIASTTAGLRRAQARGAVKALKTRTDTLAAGHDLFGRGSRLQQRTPLTGDGQSGLRNRIIISERYTNKYLPGMLSDIVQFGDTEDLLALWDSPFDLRTFDVYSADWMQRSFQDLAREKALAEVYVAAGFLDRRGIPASSVRQHWQVLRDLFVVVDETWFDHYFPRYDITPLRTRSWLRHAGNLVDHLFWTSLHDGANAESDQIDLSRIRYGDMWNGTPLDQLGIG